MRYTEITDAADAARLRVERRLLRAELRARHWILSHTAAALGVGLSTLQRALQRHPDLELEARRRGPGPGRPAQVRAGAGE
jgi:DNA-binding NtrC family response regulator